MEVREHYESLAVQPETKILGIRLLPLSVGHAKLLPAIGLSSPESLPELVAALLLCSVPSRFAMDRMRSKLWRLYANLRALLIGFAARAVSGKYKCGPAIVFIAAAQQWREYVRYYREMPGVQALRTGDGSFECKTPMLAHVERVLAEQYGMSQEAIDATPLNEALWKYSLSREASGDAVLVDSVSEEELEAMQRHADENHERWIALASPEVRT